MSVSVSITLLIVEAGVSQWLMARCMRVEPIIYSGLLY